MNYSIIRNEAILSNFIGWLPDLLPGEKLFLNLFARKKYCNILKSDKAQLKRFCATKENMADKIRQLECSVGSYKQDGVEIPQEALALYISPNPRDLVKASYNTIKALADLLKEGKSFNPHQEALTQIQKSCSRKLYSVFDIDCGEEYRDIVNRVRDFFQCRVSVIKTRGGIHVLVEHAKIPEKRKRDWYSFMSSLDNVDVKGDCLIPVPGCLQGGFLPYFV